MKEPNKRVLVGMSGGIDSTATCLMLQEQGYEIVGVTMRVWGDEPQDARELAARMGIEHYVADERIPFKDTIVKNFIDEYRQGRTPNPCVMCNPLFKFRVLTEWADRLNCNWIATGHYSRLEERNGNIYIVAGDDDKKDQSYFLWRLGQEVLRRCIFPLGNYTKLKVRDYLREKGYEAKSKEGESMEVCFIRGDYRDFLREQYPELDTEIGPGWFVNSQKNTVMLGDVEQLHAGYMLADQDHLIDEQEVLSCQNLAVRIRYRSRPIPCRVKRLEDGRLFVKFLAEASAITPGQSAVFYDGRRVIGGAFIASQRGIGLVIEENKDF